MRILCSQHAIDHCYQVSKKSVQWFQRRRFLKKLTDGRRRTQSDANSSHGLWPGDLKSTSDFILHNYFNSIISFPRGKKIIIGWNHFFFLYFFRLDTYCTFKLPNDHKINFKMLLVSTGDLCKVNEPKSWNCHLALPVLDNEATDNNF